MLESTQPENQNPFIRLDNVHLWYERNSSFSMFTNKHLSKTRKFHALRDISFTIAVDETVGIIGRNGSGKSTISRLMSLALQPNLGTIATNGKIQLLALGVGFKPVLTGRENAYISGALLGLSRKEIKEKIDDIESFAELGEFFDEPVRTYSSGMKSRLGFAVSTVVQPDILILDEVLSTGDQAFKNKARERMENMRMKTKIVILVSHNAAQVKQMCDRVIWLEKGQIMMDGDTEGILDHYESFCYKPNKWIRENQDKYNIVD